MSHPVISGLGRGRRKTRGRGARPATPRSCPAPSLRRRPRAPQPGPRRRLGFSSTCAEASAEQQDVQQRPGGHGECRPPSARGTRERPAESCGMLNPAPCPWQRRCRWGHGEPRAPPGMRRGRAWRTSSVSGTRSAFPCLLAGSHLSPGSGAGGRRPSRLLQEQPRFRLIPPCQLTSLACCIQCRWGVNLFPRYRSADLKKKKNRNPTKPPKPLCAS